MNQATNGELGHILWHSEIRGSLTQGYVRIHVYLEPETGSMRTEVEHADFLGMGWVNMPIVA